jgi:hypothetical protein
MAPARRPFLDRPIARVLAAVVLLGCVAALGYLERERLWQTATEGSAANDPFTRCFAERVAQIDRMQDDNLIEPAQAELFRTRAEAMCRAEAQGRDNAAPALPAVQ